MTDPFEMQSRFSEEDSMAYLDSIFTEPTEEALVQIERVRSILDSLPPREADFLELYYFHGRKQTDIANIFKVSQPTVCYRLQRATERIQFLLQLPEIDEAEMQRSLDDFLDDPLDVEIMVLMYRTTCQSEVASLLGVSQGLVRHRFIRSIARMKLVEHMRPFAEVFDIIRGHLNILREIKRSSREGNVLYVVD